MFKNLFKIILKILGTLAALALVSFCSVFGKVIGEGVSKQSEIRSRDIMDGMTDAMHKINLTTPKMVDPETRLDKVSIGDNKTFIYHYTLIDLEHQSADKSFGTTLRDSLLPTACANDELIPFMKKGVSLKHIYSSNDNVLLGTFTANKYSCGFES